LRPTHSSWPTPEIEGHIPLLEGILHTWKDSIGPDFDGYKNHAYRMAHFCFALHDCSEDERQKVAIAAGFHDLGIWSARTVDYLPPSIAGAADYLKRNDLANWSVEIARMIDEHHKLRPNRDPDYPLVEVFRRADLVDVSLGLVTFGVPRSYIRRVQRQFPDAGFHWRLVRLLGEWFSRHPASPPPFFKW
jgi:hypothetical protein